VKQHHKINNNNHINRMISELEWTIYVIIHNTIMEL
jgi:hypothetical protein